MYFNLEDEDYIISRKDNLDEKSINLIKKLFKGVTNSYKYKYDNQDDMFQDYIEFIITKQFLNKYNKDKGSLYTLLSINIKHFVINKYITTNITNNKNKIHNIDFNNRINIAMVENTKYNQEMNNLEEESEDLYNPELDISIKKIKPTEYKVIDELILYTFINKYIEMGNIHKAAKQVGYSIHLLMINILHNKEVLKYFYNKL